MYQFISIPLSLSMVISVATINVKVEVEETVSAVGNPNNGEMRVWIREM